MDWNTGETLVLSKFLAGTTTGIQWLVRFCWSAHEEVLTGTYDESRWVIRFRETIERNMPNFLDRNKKEGAFLKINPDKVDWAQLFKYCMDFTKPPQKDKSP
jgi:hypothetical protein